MISHAEQKANFENWVKSLKKGDEVAIYTYGARLSCKYAIRTVEKVTPTGRVKLSNGTEFNYDGSERGGNRSIWGNSVKLEQLTPEIQNIVDSHNAVVEIENLVSKKKLESLPLENLQSILSLLKQTNE